ncbi:hypothetical protein [Luteibacter sahnii]|jgi:hypothetical protein|uniref:hypothetical protein n=1 Tax=Luteibacter sahnii TaxID=3021977 RepID=UPI002A6A5199|nr:hypothetical protein [Luteibacter sp. PPL193]MDY1549640.1 hypothetical protein [Luteibacter sp. PPL193]
MAARVVAIVLLALVAVAVAWQWHADDTEARDHMLTGLDPAAITHLDVSLRGFATQRFERRDDHWTADGATPVDAGRVEELAQLARTPVDAWKPSSDVDPTRIGLSPPTAVLTLDGTRLEFGDMTALGKRRYVRVGDRVAIVPAQALPRPPRMQALATSPGP